MLDLLATGYPSLDYICQVSHLPRTGETARIEYPKGRYTFGGCCPNVAVGLARLGCNSGVALVLGDDLLGQRYLDYLNMLKVNTHDVVVLPSSKTSESHIYVDGDGEYQNFFYGGASDQWESVLSADILNNSKTALITAGPMDWNRQFVRLARQNGTRLVWQLKPDVYSYPPDYLRELVRQTSMLFVNRIELDYLSSALNTASPGSFLSDPMGVVIVTLGSVGSRVYHGNKIEDIPVVEPLRLVDVTGAGDGFTTGFLAGWLQNRSLDVCARMGAVVSSFVLETVGCQENLPDWKKMESRYQKNFGAL